MFANDFASIGGELNNIGSKKKWKPACDLDELIAHKCHFEFNKKNGHHTKIKITLKDGSGRRRAPDIHWRTLEAYGVLNHKSN